MQKNLKSDHIGLSYGPKQVENGPNLRFFATFGHLATPRRPYTPVITSRHISYMISDMSEHYSDHFRGVSGWFEAPRGPKNCDFLGFWHVPRPGDPNNGSGTHDSSYTHPIHILRHVCALFRAFLSCSGLIWGSDRAEQLQSLRFLTCSTTRRPRQGLRDL